MKTSSKFVISKGFKGVRPPLPKINILLMSMYLIKTGMSSEVEECQVFCDNFKPCSMLKIQISHITLNVFC